MHQQRAKATLECQAFAKPPWLVRGTQSADLQGVLHHFVVFLGQAQL